MKIAILLACHGNRDLTLKSLKSLAAYLPSSAEKSLFVVDDHCPEHSGVAADTYWKEQKVGPSTLLQPREHKLFWARAMKAAEEKAIPYSPDFIVWLNQDTIVTQNLNPYFKTDKIVVCSCSLPPDGSFQSKQEFFKGARVRSGPVKFRLARLEDPEPCTFNGNLVIIPKSAYTRLRIKPFQHAFADYAYGLDATALGIPISKTPVIAHTQPQRENWAKKKTIKERWLACTHPTGLPFSDWWDFCLEYGDNYWLLRFLYSYRHLIKKC